MLQITFKKKKVLCYKTYATIIFPKMNIYFKDDFFFFNFGLLKCHQQTDRQNNAESIIGLPGFCILYWTTYTVFTVVLRLSCPFIRLTNLSKASRTMSVMSETLTEVTAHARTPMTPVNHCQNDKKPFWGHRAVERYEPSHSDSVDLPTQLRRSPEQFCLCHLNTLVFLGSFYDAFQESQILPNVLVLGMKADQPHFLCRS